MLGSLGKEGKSTQGPTVSLKKFLESDIFAPNYRSCSGELEVGGSDNRGRKKEKRSLDPLFGLRFTLAVDEKQETEMALRPRPVCKTQLYHVRDLTTKSLIHIPCLFFL